MANSLVVTPEGLPIGYEIFAGNTADVTTVEQMVEWMEKKYGQPKRIWVLDRGMVSEKNIEFLRRRQARYIVGTPKSQLKQFEASPLAWRHDRLARGRPCIKKPNHRRGAPARAGLRVMWPTTREGTPRGRLFRRW